jgi:hypothetical protein
MDYKQNDKTWEIPLSPQKTILFYSFIAGILAAFLMAAIVVSIESQGRDILIAYHRTRLTELYCYLKMIYNIE